MSFQRKIHAHNRYFSGERGWKYRVEAPRSAQEKRERKHRERPIAPQRSAPGLGTRHRREALLPTLLILRQKKFKITQDAISLLADEQSPKWQAMGMPTGDNEKEATVAPRPSCWDTQPSAPLTPASPFGDSVLEIPEDPFAPQPRHRLVPFSPEGPMQGIAMISAKRSSPISSR